jgi:hypothetical protein
VIAVDDGAVVVAIVTGVAALTVAVSHIVHDVDFATADTFLITTAMVNAVVADVLAVNIVTAVVGCQIAAVLAFKCEQLGTVRAPFLPSCVANIDAGHVVTPVEVAATFASCEQFGMTRLTVQLAVDTGNQLANLKFFSAVCTFSIIFHFHN